MAGLDYVVESNVILNYDAVFSSVNFNISTKLKLPFIFILKKGITHSYKEK